MQRKRGQLDFAILKSQGWFMYINEAWRNRNTYGLHSRQACYFHSPVNFRRRNDHLQGFWGSNLIFMWYLSAAMCDRNTCGPHTSTHGWKGHQQTLRPFTCKFLGQNSLKFYDFFLMRHRWLLYYRQCQEEGSLWWIMVETASFTPPRAL